MMKFFEQHLKKEGKKTVKCRECKSTEMKEDMKTGLCLLFEKNLILQLLFQALQKYITRFLLDTKKNSFFSFLSSLFRLLHCTITEWNVVKGTKILTKKIPFLRRAAFFGVHSNNPEAMNIATCKDD